MAHINYNNSSGVGISFLEVSSLMPGFSLRHKHNHSHKGSEYAHNAKLKKNVLCSCLGLSLCGSKIEAKKRIISYFLMLSFLFSFIRFFFILDGLCFVPGYFQSPLDG